MEGDPYQPSLYDPQHEHDSCGVGFIADISGRSQRRVLDLALQALANLEHRGAIDADGKTGDGGGVLTRIPQRLFCSEAERLGWRATSQSELAVGMFFLPPDASAHAKLREVVERCVRNYGLTLVGWRSVPVDDDALGQKARSTAPRIEQALIGAQFGSVDLYEQTLYLIRKQIERETADVPQFYVVSLSGQTIVYKGLMVASQLAAYYRDLRDPDFETSIAVFHQRYSTNTRPNWTLAQPFRLLAHNGEINTISGNRIWMSAREMDSDSQAHWEQIRPIVQEGRSDSCSLDNAFELMTRSGRSPLESMMMLIPEALDSAQSDDLAAFYEYAACLMEPWDGPAAVVFSDGRFVGATLDRNGLRPARYTLTNDGLVVMASEAGAVPIELESIVENGRLGPGEMIAVDVIAQRFLLNSDIKSERGARQPYAKWLKQSMVVCPSGLDVAPSDEPEREEFASRLKVFSYTAEDLNRILEPMFSEAKEPAGSMGDDTPLAVLSQRPRPFYHYFKQRFAQVTNPAIDPIRERTVMSLETLLGARGSLFEDGAANAGLLKLRSPVLTDQELTWLRSNESGRFECISLAALFDSSSEEMLEPALKALCSQAALAVDAGASVLVLSDRDVSESLAPIPMLVAVSAVHHHLIRTGRRMHASIIAEAGDAREDHHVACLIGYGASAVNPYLAFEVVAAEMNKRGMSVAAALRNYKDALEGGLLKIMAKMGIATVASYCGGQIFEAIGLDRGLISGHFPGTPSAIGGARLENIAREVLAFHHAAYQIADDHELEDAGYFRYRNGGEFHSFNPSVFRALHRAIKHDDQAAFNRYREEIESRPPTTVRDLLEFRESNSIPVDEVEPASEIVRRFCVSGMSLGALSREAHETIAIAMNRMGARSNSGEGGENHLRYKPKCDGDSSNSRIKQVASARFGVTPAYLVSADELEIKISQGSKPGEGGQLPGQKVTAEIAEIRHSVPGVTLISPPPHHDIYSIEDLAQLIYDLKQINPKARVAVKLVSESGVGTVAAGVAKAHADVVHISGHDGGTGASPLGSIKNAGSPWELGLAETHQVLVMNGLRDRVRVRTDGGLKAGRDVVIAAMLGADEFGFASAVLVALGCVMARQCHLNTCPVGIATQAPHLRERFAGKPEMVVAFFMSLAEDVRRVLANLGFHSLGEAVGRSDMLLEKRVDLGKQVRLDLRAVIADAKAPDSEAKAQTVEPAPREKAPTLDVKIVRDVWSSIANGRRVLLSYEVKNTDRAVGAKLAGEITRCFGVAGLPTGAVDIKFRGSAGQSFGAFLTHGMRLRLMGEANDYVGKGMGGGEIAVRPPDEAHFDWSRNVIVGNTVMYGATGGSLFVAGRAGERFCVRNSGGTSVVEGVGDHGCEYMTAGTVLVLGEVGRNFAAGMTGGVAYVLDTAGTFEERCNRELVELEIASGLSDEGIIRQLLQRHYELTGSPLARSVLWHWPHHRRLIWKLVTQACRAQADARPVVASEAGSELRIAAAE